MKQGGSKQQPSIAEEEAATGDQSIQRFGSEAEGSEKEAVLAVMHSFLEGMAQHDYKTVCSILSAANRDQLRMFAKQTQEKGLSSCTSILERILPRVASEARKAAAGTISKVRIGEGSAFVLFRPVSGKVSYFVMREEDGTWKATGLAPGTPLNP